MSPSIPAFLEGCSVLSTSSITLRICLEESQCRSYLLHLIPSPQPLIWGPSGLVGGRTG